MQALLDGYRRFREHQWPERRAVFQRLSEGQSPPVMVVACSDSRIDPAMIFGAGPGEIFVLRNVANLVPPYDPDTKAHAASAALEYAVRILEVTDIIVLGHAMCGGIKALLRGTPAFLDFVGPWMAHAEPAKHRALAGDPADPQAACEQEAVKLSLENLRGFPWIAEREFHRRLALHGAMFDIRSGVLTILDAGGRFVPA